MTVRIKAYEVIRIKTNNLKHLLTEVLFKIIKIMETYKSQTKIIKHTFEAVPKDVIEKRIIIQFLNELPIDKLRQLVSFEDIDFSDIETIEKSRRDEYLIFLLKELHRENAVQYNCRLTI